jgi:amino acid adenylation domain-containing protein/non-ribosomal peptide synthase protein (TIGR01720 family)
MVGHFQTLLKGIVANPQQTVRELPLLTESEKQQLLEDWNQTQQDYPQNLCIHQLFEAWVEQTPDAIALIFKGEQLTYRELNSKANQLANYLQTLGVKPETLVGICIEPSLEMIVGILGILKAAGAYVPIDPTYPSERIAYMLDDSQLAVLLTQEKLVTSLPQHQAQVICLDSDWKEISTESKSSPITSLTPENLAYVIYTSGSTGKPKGVLVAHRGLCNLSQAQIKLFDVQPDSCVLQFASISFDASIWEIVMALCAGARLYLGTREELQPGQPLLQLLQEQEITHLTLVPSALTALSSENLPALQNIIVAGEPCPPSLVIQWASGRRFFNAYGPTESTVCATVAQCFEDMDVLPIGRPIANTKIYILDRYLQPVPIGVPGELHLASVGLAKGYLNRPELTDSKFIANPFSQKLSDRLYKTGDLVRYGNDGQIEFVGRIDDQVKIRGFRIELGEIESVLNQYPQVKDAIVIVRQDELKTKRLYGYFIPKTEALTSQELRQFIQDRLPDYMIPAFLIPLESFPLTPNGKVDRRALPLPKINPNELENYATPSTKNEQILAQIWQEVLGLKTISINDNFFELGGDSILAIQIIAKANQEGLEITPKQLFGYQTIAQLAILAETTAATEIDQGLVTGEVPLTPIQQWFFEQNWPERHHFNQSILLEVPNNLQPDLLKQTISKLLYHHDALRLRFIQKGEKWQQNHSDDCNSFAFELVDLSHLYCDEQVTTLAEISEVQQRTLKIDQGPLMAVVFFKLGDSGRLLIVIHHLAVDGVSWRIILEDLATIYQQLESQDSQELPPKTSSFKTWAEELQNYAKTPEFYAQFKYWLNRDLPAVFPLPLDYQGEAKSNIVAHAKTVSFTLTEEQTRLLLQEVPQAYNTQINDILLTALVQAFSHWTGSDRLLLDMEGHGRENVIESVNLSRTVGWFTSIYPVFLTLENLDHPGECLKSIKEQLRQIPNRGFDYGIGYYLNSDLTIQSQLKNYPKAQVSFNYLGQFTSHQIGDIGWKLSQESSGSIHSPLGQRSHLIAIHGIVVDGQLDMEWQYSENFHHQTTIKNLAAAYRDSLESLINHCLSAEGGYTPSDFPDADLNQAELDELLLELDF